MATLKIQKSAISACLAGAKSAYPNEFLGLLEGEKQGSGQSASLTITRLIVPPGLSVSNFSASYLDWLLPTVSNIWGTFHSHPGAATPKPSRADLRLYSKEGGVHLIACEPFTPANLAAYDGKGRRLEFAIIN